MKKNKILIYTNYGLEKMVFKTFLNVHKTIYIKHEAEFERYLGINFTYIIINIDTESLTAKLNKVLLDYKEQCKSHIIFITTSLQHSDLEKFVFNSVIEKPYQICDIIKIVDASHL